LPRSPLPIHRRAADQAAVDAVLPLVGMFIGFAFLVLKVLLSSA